MILELSKRKATVFFETSRNIHPATQRNIQHDGNPPLHHMKPSKLARIFLFLWNPNVVISYRPTHFL